MNLIGVDLGIHHVALAVFLDHKMTSAHKYSPISQGRRDVELREMGAFVHAQALYHQVDYVFLEEVLLGNNRRYSLQLAETKGAVMAELAPLRSQQGCDIRTVDVGTWKKAVLGNGHASKEDIVNYISASTPYAPLCGDVQDCYDAACIGLYGEQILERASTLSLTD